MGAQLAPVTVPELSVVGTLKLTTLVSALAGRETGANCGQVRTGASVSNTVIGNEQLARLELVSNTKQSTIVLPIAKFEPDAGEHSTAPETATLSLATRL